MNYYQSHITFVSENESLYQEIKAILPSKAIKFQLSKPEQVNFKKTLIF